MHKSSFKYNYSITIKNESCHFHGKQFRQGWEQYKQFRFLCCGKIGENQTLYVLN